MADQYTSAYCHRAELDERTATAPRPSHASPAGCPRSGYTTTRMKLIPTISTLGLMIRHLEMGVIENQPPDPGKPGGRAHRDPGNNIACEFDVPQPGPGGGPREVCAGNTNPSAR